MTTAATSGRRRALRFGAFACVLAALVVARASSWLAGDRSLEELAPDYAPVAGTTELDNRAGSPFDVTARPLPAAGALPARWLVLCWDGATWDLVLPFLAEGRLPNLAALMRGGTYGNLLTIKPTLSPVVWTTIATGVSPARHGVIGLQKGQAEGTRIHDPGAPLYDNADRRSKALWNILSENGRTVLSVGYHATFPVEAVSGAMVSNYAIRREHTYGYQAPVMDEASRRPQLVYPAALWTELEPSQRRRPRDVTWSEMRRFVDVGAADFARLTERAARVDSAQDRWSFLLKAYLYDQFHAEAGLRLWVRSRPTVALVHFQALDWAGHWFLYYHWPTRFLNVPPPREPSLDATAFRPTVRAFYEYLDEWLGRFLVQRDAETGVMILSDHGMEPVPDLAQGGHDNAPPGLLLMNGPGIPAGVRVSGVTIYDVLPTLLASLGLPLSRELPGRVIVGSPGPGQPTLETYGPYRHPRPTLGQSGMEERLREEFRALGYIQ
ncbi:MAG TPA: alkaline phosphatase family protein [Vicinamibacteria bacterium]|jgi:arylsulfatase A-like enzyme